MLNEIEEKDIDELYKKKSNIAELCKVKFTKDGNASNARDILQN